METSYSLLLFDNDKTVGKTTSKSIIHTVLGPWVQIFKGSKIDFGVISTDPDLIFEMTLWSCLKVNRGELWREGGALVNFLEHWDIYIYIYTILKRTLVVVSGPSPPCATVRMARSSWRVACPRMSASTPWSTSCWWRSLRSAATTPWMEWRYIAGSQISWEDADWLWSKW